MNDGRPSFEKSNSAEAARASRPDPQAAFIADVDLVLAELRAMLIAKNKAYGDSALNPVRITTKANPRELITARIDDKLKRLRDGSSDGEDIWLDLRGYLVILAIYDKRHPTQTPQNVVAP